MAAVVLPPITASLATSLSDLATTFTLLLPVLTAAICTPEFTPALAHLLAHFATMTRMVSLR